jgi:uncharacterized protein (TIGR01244 family)
MTDYGILVHGGNIAFRASNPKHRQSSGGISVVEPKTIAPGLAVSKQPDITDIKQLAEQGFRTIINNRPEGEDPEQLPPAEEQAEAERLGLTYVHIPVKTGSITAADIDAFRRAVQESPQPVLAHCKGGTRSYLLWAVGEALSGERDPHELVDEAAAAGYKLQSLPDLAARLKA